MGFSDILNNADAENRIQGADPVPVSPSDNDSLQNQDAAFLPADFTQTCKSIIDNFAENEIKTDMIKAAQSQWSAACMLIGQYVKQNQLNIDKEKTAKRNCKTINAAAVAEMVDIWVFLCSFYHKTPLVFDFMRFADVSESWLYDKAGHGLTSSGGAIHKKILQLQDYGIAADLSDGKKNPTGLIFLSKAKMGWNENGITRSGADGINENIQSFPDLAGLLPKKDG